MALYGNFFNFMNGGGGGGLTRTSPLSDVNATTVWDIDATISDSYSGTGQTINSLGTPADSQPASAYAFQLGATSGASTDDPSFVGTPGDPAAYFLCDGTDVITKAAANTAFINSLHKTTGGSDFWFAIARQAPSNVIVMADTSNDLTGVGVMFNNTGTDLVRLFQTGATFTSAITTGTTTDNIDTLIIFSHSHSANQTRIWINSDTAEELSHTFSTTTADAAGVLTLLGNSAGGDKAPNGTRFYGAAMGNSYLDNTAAAAIRDQLELRHDRFYRDTRPLIFDVKTDNTGVSSSNQFRVPTLSSATYDCEVRWGDGTTSTITTWDDPAWTHTYPSAGTYEIEILGTFEAFYFTGAGDRLKILDIKQWGDTSWLTFVYAFRNCTNLVISATDAPDLSSGPSMLGAFQLCTFNSDLSHWDTSNVQNMGGTFLQHTGNPDISGWDFSSCASLFQFAYNASNFNPAIGGADFSNVSSWVQAFISSGLDQDFSGITTTAAISFAQAFANTDISFDPTGWDMNGVTRVDVMFAGATSMDYNYGLWDWTTITNATSFLSGVTLSTTNYDSTLTGIEAQAVQNDVVFDAGNSTYTAASAAATARAALIADHNWTITDGGTA